ncbi:hypothetical protein QAD02_021449 [Eretmocerus hayati]|uniref:Uncharacterized protein n=1 Tax=Eretmocerus hayati TaxID=131215 RepID=A0ACC2PQ71_9HYME|nr:hypothetical protein QAD02_021449 [Eretmocerus hayati]
MSQQQTQSQPQPSPLTLAEIMSLPTKEQAIVVDSMDGITINDYLLALAEIVNPTDIKSISKISNKRVCVYLKSKQLAEQLVSSNSKIFIQSQSLEVRHLIAKNV